MLRCLSTRILVVQGLSETGGGITVPFWNDELWDYVLQIIECKQFKFNGFAEELAPWQLLGFWH
jgi:hypothetical protein